MGVRLAEILLVASALAAPVGAAVTAPRSSTHDVCRVVGREKLPVHMDEHGICRAIAQAMAAKAPAARYKVDVQVLTKSRLAAVLTVNGRPLPAENMAVSDGEIGPGSIRRFAERLAALAGRN